MAGENLARMNEGDGEKSYAKNSRLQELVILKAQPVLKDTIREMFSTKLPYAIILADLGCSSGPNSLLVISQILETIQEIRPKHQSPPEIQVFLNDLPGNDFNNLFKLLPSLHGKHETTLRRSCFVAGVPGSFYGRLFPASTVHFFHSSYTLHWLSKVPEGLENNKGSICISRCSPPDVIKAYFHQFQTDFSLFLSSRAEELRPGGRIMLVFNGRRDKDPSPTSYGYCSYLLELISQSFTDLIESGLVKQEDVDTFNLPVFTPHEEEILAIVKQQGSFHVDQLQIFETNWDPDDREDNIEFEFDKYQSGQRVAAVMRAVTEPSLASHFGGGTIMDHLFNRYALRVADHLCLEKTKYFNIILTMTKKHIIG